jgi:D-sedoheptulose 7-phosphate isomerase
MIRSAIIASIEAKKALLESQGLLDLIQKTADNCLGALRQNKKIILAGNGGSFADAQHISAEFVCRFLINRVALPSITLGCNSSTVTAIGNDYGYDHVFARELYALAEEGDIFIPISTSGNSPNILAAIEVANQKNIQTIGLTGQNGGRMKSLCDCIQIPSESTPRIQECHILIGHIMCEYIEEKLFGKTIK